MHRNIPEILLATTAIIFLVGLGYLLSKDLNYNREKYQLCVDNQMQWVSGNCVR